MTLEQPTLDMAFSAMLSSQASARASRPRAAVYFKNSQGRIVVPLKINGPVANPAVNLNAENFAQSKLPPPVEKKLGSFFRELFRDR